MISVFNNTETNTASMLWLYIILTYNNTETDELVQQAGHCYDLCIQQLWNWCTNTASIIIIMIFVYNNTGTDVLIQLVLLLYDLCIQQHWNWCINTASRLLLLLLFYLCIQQHWNWWTNTASILGCASGGVYVPCIYTACQVRITVGDSGLCCCVCVTSFERELTPLRVDTTAGVIITSSLFYSVLSLRQRLWPW